MLRLSQTEERICREFSEVYGCGSGLGRVFRSPTLFEDMVKCILLCNCQYDSLVRQMFDVMFALSYKASKLELFFHVAFLSLCR